MDNENIVIALYDYKGTTDEELSLRAGQELIVLNDENDDWWYVTDATTEEEGYAPSTFLRYKNASPLKDQPIQEVVEEDCDSDTESNSSENDEYEEEEEEKTSPNTDDDLLSVIKQQKLEQLRRRSSIKPAQGHKLIAPEIFKELELFPHGFRYSTLAKNRLMGVGALSKHLLPEVDSSGMAFKDLFLDHKKKTIRKRPVKSTVAFSIMDARNIPFPSGKVKVLGRHVRMAIFDKTNILSNIHSVDAIFNPEFENTWKFSSKASLLFPKDDENTCFLRVNDLDIRLSILFELCLICEIPNKDTEGTYISEISCGWGLLPLFTADGGPMENKTYEIKLYGGTPFEKNVDLANIQAEKKGFLQGLLNTSKSPKLFIRVWKLGKTAMEDMNTLPDILVHSLAVVPLLVIYRRCLGTLLLQNINNANSTYEPWFKIFPQLLESNDFLRLFLSIWEKKKRLLKKKSFANIKAAFTLVIHSLWPLLEICNLPTYIPGDNSNFSIRSSYIQALLEKGSIEFMTGMQDSVNFKSFSTSEVEAVYLKRAMEVCKSLCNFTMSDLEELFGSDISDTEPIKADPTEELQEDERIVQENEEEMDKMDTKEDEEEIVENLEIANTGGPIKENQNIFLTKMPFFLGYDPMPWDPLNFDPQFDENDDSEDVLLTIQNTIRWRNHPTLEKESNTRLVKWSDGSFSLMIGDELFEANVNDVSKSHFTLLQYHQSQGCFQTVTKFKKNMAFRPHSTSSITHKKLTRAIAKKHAKTDKTKTLITKEDPDKARNELEKRVNENMKAQRRREAKERALLEKTMGDGEYDSDLDASYRRGDSSLLNRLNKYSDEGNDGFIDDDEDSDDDVQKSRLLQAKRDEDEDMSDAMTDRSEKDKPSIHSRKLRIIESDESD